MRNPQRLIEALWAAMGYLLSKAVPLVGSILLIRIFGPDGYGKYAMTVATVNLLLTATGAGLVGGLVATIAAGNGVESAEARRQKVHGFATVNLGLLLLALVGSAVAALFGLFDKQLAALIAANWLPMLLLVAFQVQIAAQSAEATVVGLLKRLAFTSLCGGILVTLLQIAGGFNWGVTGALWGMTLGYGGQVLLQARYLRAHPGKSAQTSGYLISSPVALAAQAWADFVRYGGYMFGSSVVVSIGMWLLSFFLLRAGAGTHLVAAFGVMNHWRMLMVFLPLALSNYLISRFAAVSDPLSRLRILRISLVAVIPLAALAGGTFLFTDNILRFVYGISYVGLTRELCLTALIALLSGINSIFGNFLTGSHLYKQGLVSNLVWFFTLAGALTFLQRHGFNVMEATLCLLAAYVVHTCYQLSVLLRSYRSARIHRRVPEA